MCLYHVAIDAYVKILCEGEKIVSDKQLANASPKWNIKATFYRKHPDTDPIIVEVCIMLLLASYPLPQFHTNALDCLFKILYILKIDMFELNFELTWINYECSYVCEI
jgi:hypothetical protein